MSAVMERTEEEQAQAIPMADDEIKAVMSRAMLRDRGLTIRIRRKGGKFERDKVTLKGARLTSVKTLPDGRISFGVKEGQIYTTKAPASTNDFRVWLTHARQMANRRAAYGQPPDDVEFDCLG